jgi:hypothetical protein
MSSRVDLFSILAHETFDSLDVQHKCDLINAFWPNVKATDSYVSEDYIVLFDFITKTFRGLHRHRNCFADHHLESLLSTVEKLRTGHVVSRKDTIDAIKSQHLNVEKDLIRHSVELAARLWSGVNIESEDAIVNKYVSQDTRINWPDDSSLTSAIAAHFQHRSSRHGDSGLALDGTLNAVNIKSRRGLAIIWTDNLLDHMKLRGQRKDRSLTIFRQMSLLLNHRESPNPIIAVNILEEAILTLEVLFPFGEEKTMAFLKSEGVHLHVSGASSVKRAVELDEFKYWRSEMTQLKQLLEGPPETMGQTLLDTQNFGQFFTIWVAIIGVFLLTIIFGILSSVYTVKQYSLAVKSYDLALAVACEEHPALSGFCTQ